MAVENKILLFFLPIFTFCSIWKTQSSSPQPSEREPPASLRAVREINHVKKEIHFKYWKSILRLIKKKINTPECHLIKLNSQTLDHPKQTVKVNYYHTKQDTRDSWTISILMVHTAHLVMVMGIHGKYFFHSFVKWVLLVIYNNIVKKKQTKKENSICSNHLVWEILFLFFIETSDDIFFITKSFKHQVDCLCPEVFWQSTEIHIYWSTHYSECKGMVNKQTGFRRLFYPTGKTVQQQNEGLSVCLSVYLSIYLSIYLSCKSVNVTVLKNI